MAKIAFDNVSLDYKRKTQTICALRDISFQIDNGEAVCLIGPSGCGKSSILRLASALIKPTEGEIFLDDAILEHPRRNTSLILQDFGLLPWKNVLKNVELGLKIRHVDRRERLKRAQDAIEMVGLVGFESAFPNELSGGMKQRVAIARSLALDADLMLMDEPLSALDTLLREQMQETIKSLWQKCSYTQILVTHSIEEAVFLGQKIFIMDKNPGRIVNIVENEFFADENLRISKHFHQKCDQVRDILNMNNKKALEA